MGELADAARGKIERLVLMSSVRAQAGLAADHVITEADPPQPTDAYGRAKLEAERLLAASGAGFAVLRPAVVYGKGVKGNIASLATLAQTPMPLPFGGLDNKRSLLAIENLLRRSISPSPRRAPKARPFSSPTPSRSPSPTWSPPCARALAARLTSFACRRAR